MLARDRNPAEAEEKEQFVGSVVPGRTGEGAARLSEHEWLGTLPSPALTLLTCSVISSLWVGLVSFSPTADGLLCGTGDLAAGNCG